MPASRAHHYALILAGGRGTRFWPRSRTKTPKQLLGFLGTRSLLQQTVDRLRSVIPPERVWILTNEHLRGAIRRQLPDVPARQVLAEPAQRNTAPCLGLAAQILASVDRDALLGVFPADHYISEPARFRRLLGPAYRAAAAGDLVVLGIRPRWPETGYGYVEFPPGVEQAGGRPLPVLRFREKPDRATAEQFLRAGRFYWNAGMFFWRAEVFRDALRRHLPRTAALLASLPPFGDRRFGARLRESYPRCENISVDFAVMEKAANVMGLAAGEIGWNDLGSWNALYELLPRDGDGNVARTAALLDSARGCYIDAPGKLVALVGVEDLIVVDTPDALLVARRDRAQRVGDVVKRLEKQKRRHLL